MASPSIKPERRDAYRAYLNKFLSEKGSRGSVESPVTTVHSGGSSSISSASRSGSSRSVDSLCDTQQEEFLSQELKQAVSETRQIVPFLKLSDREQNSLKDYLNRHGASTATKTPLLEAMYMLQNAHRRGVFSISKGSTSEEAAVGGSNDRDGPNCVGYSVDIMSSAPCSSGGVLPSSSVLPPAGCTIYTSSPKLPANVRAYNSILSSMYSEVSMGPLETKATPSTQSQLGSTMGRKVTIMKFIDELRDSLKASPEGSLPAQLRLLHSIYDEAVRYTDQLDEMAKLRVQLAVLEEEKRHLMGELRCCWEFKPSPTLDESNSGWGNLSRVSSFDDVITSRASLVDESCDPQSQPGQRCQEKVCSELATNNQSPIMDLITADYSNRHHSCSSGFCISEPPPTSFCVCSCLSPSLNPAGVPHLTSPQRPTTPTLHETAGPSSEGPTNCMQLSVSNTIADGGITESPESNQKPFGINLVSTSSCQTDISVSSHDLIWGMLSASCNLTPGNSASMETINNTFQKCLQHNQKRLENNLADLFIEGFSTAVRSSISDSCGSEKTFIDADGCSKTEEVSHDAMLGHEHVSETVPCPQRVSVSTGPLAVDCRLCNEITMTVPGHVSMQGGLCSSEMESLALGHGNQIPCSSKDTPVQCQSEMELGSVPALPDTNDVGVQGMVLCSTAHQQTDLSCMNMVELSMEAKAVMTEASTDTNIISVHTFSQVMPETVSVCVSALPVVSTAGVQNACSMIHSGQQTDISQLNLVDFAAQTGLDYRISVSSQCQPVTLSSSVQVTTSTTAVGVQKGFPCLDLGQQTDSCHVSIMDASVDMHVMMEDVCAGPDSCTLVSMSSECKPVTTSVCILAVPEYQDAVVQNTFPNIDCHQQTDMSQNDLADASVGTHIAMLDSSTGMTDHLLPSRNVSSQCQPDLTSLAVSAVVDCMSIGVQNTRSFLLDQGQQTFISQDSCVDASIGNSVLLVDTGCQAPAVSTIWSDAALQMQPIMKEVSMLTEPVHERDQCFDCGARLIDSSPEEASPSLLAVHPLRVGTLESVGESDSVFVSDATTFHGQEDSSDEMMVGKNIKPAFFVGNEDDDVFEELRPGPRVQVGELHRRDNLRDAGVSAFAPRPSLVSLQARTSVKRLEDHFLGLVPLQEEEAYGLMVDVQNGWMQLTLNTSIEPVAVKAYLDMILTHLPHFLDTIITLADDDGNTVLHFAVTYQVWNAVNVVLNYSCVSVDIRNKSGFSPIMLASTVGYSHVSDRSSVRRLFESGNINIRSLETGRTPLMIAVQNNDEDILSLLLMLDSDINAQDYDGRSALMHACLSADPVIVKMVLQHPACDANLEDNDGSTAITLAMDADRREVALLVYGSLNFESRGRMKLSPSRQNLLGLGSRRSPSPVVGR